MNEPSANSGTQPTPETMETKEIDDRLREVPTPERNADTTAQAKAGLVSFVLVRLDALEKPMLEESLAEPNGGSPCACNSVCACVPVDTCACNQVCTCDTVETCHSYGCDPYGCSCAPIHTIYFYGC